MFSFSSRHLFKLEVSAMAALQKPGSSSLMGTLAASCLLLIALWTQGGLAVPIRSHCRLDGSNFQQPYITNRTFMLAKEARLADNNTDVRLIGEKLFYEVNMGERCYLMKQVLNFTLEEVLLPQSDRFQPYMQEVVPFLARLSNKLSPCHIDSDDQHIQRNVQNLKDTVKKAPESIGERGTLPRGSSTPEITVQHWLKWEGGLGGVMSLPLQLGENGEIKVIGELDLLFMALRNACN
ncbi:interleukin-22 [Prionailurus iriomotensis]